MVLLNMRLATVKEPSSSRFDGEGVKRYDVSFTHNTIQLTSTPSS
jgi:hypothetical protein